MPFEGLKVSPTFDLKKLRAARVLAHWAAQLPAAVGNTLAAKREDGTHASLRWIPETQTLSTIAFGDTRICRVGVRPRDLTVLLHDDAEPFSELSLVDVNFEEALGWLADQIRDNVVPRLESLVPYSREGLPDHPVGKGAAFELADPAAHEEIARGFDNARLVLDEIRTFAESPGLTLCSPRNFDIAFVDSVEHLEGVAPRTVKTGFHPGDHYYDEPYWYVTPRPTPKIPSKALPELASGGTWHTQEWLGAVLKMRSLEGAGEEDVATALARFLAGAVVACRAVTKPL